MLARETGDWQTTTDQAERLGLSESAVSTAYWQAMQWVRQLNSV
jgi:hypothetical protein